MLFFSIPQRASAVPDSKTIPGSYTIRAHNQGYAGPTQGYSTAVSTSPWSPEKGQEKDSPTHQPHSAPANYSNNHERGNMISTCMPQQSAWPILGASEAEKYRTRLQVAITTASISHSRMSAYRTIPSFSNSNRARLTSLAKAARL